MYNNQTSPSVHTEAKKKKKGLWYYINARRKAGKRPKRPGEKGYPKTLKIKKTTNENLLRELIKEIIIDATAE
jgi:hypothetical protein